jgi:hypothetical protein
MPDYVRPANAVSCPTATDWFAVAQDELGDLAVAQPGRDRAVAAPE